jgi:hypothetical protein
MGWLDLLVEPGGTAELPTRPFGSTATRERMPRASPAGAWNPGYGRLTPRERIVVSLLIRFTPPSLTAEQYGSRSCVTDASGDSGGSFDEVAALLGGASIPQTADM